MRTLVLGFAFFVLFAVLTLGVFAFVIMDINPQTWTGDARFAYVIISVGLSTWLSVLCTRLIE